MPGLRLMEQVDVRGPVDGTGENDLRGDYYRIAIVFNDDEFVRGKVTRAQLEELRDQINHHIAKAEQQAVAKI